jgi:metallophosphoesterase superfamily enzyme
MHVLNDWLLTAECAAVHLPTRTAVVADLHLGYAEARRRRGDAVPNESIEELLRPLIRIKQQYATEQIVIAGDLLEEGSCCQALAQFLHWIDQNDMKLLAVVPGNHDRGAEAFAAAKARLPLHPEGIDVGGWRILHSEGWSPDIPVVHGHEHPYVRWSPKSRANRPRSARSRFAPNTIDGPCYLSGPRRLILPAFSQEAAGVNILSVRRWRALRCHLVAGNRVIDLGEVSTLGHRLWTAYD